MNHKSLSTSLPCATLIATTLLIAGCSEEKLGRVTGRVIFEGQPVEGAVLEFQPEGQSGAPSYGKVDPNGHYTLMYSASTEGAEIGTHLVKITTAKRVDDGGRIIREKLPPRYNRSSELIRQVDGGENVIDFTLTKK